MMKLKIWSFNRKLLLIEEYVDTTGILLAFLVLFGSYRRRYHHSFFKFLVWIAYILSRFLMSYTLGMMRSPNSIRNQIFPFWAAFLLIVLGSADSISAYSIEDNKSHTRYQWEFLVQFIWVFWLYLSYNYAEITKFAVPVSLLLIIAVLKKHERAKAMRLGSKSFGLMRNAKLIADFMGYEHELRLREQHEVDPTCMTGYNYLVAGEESGKVTEDPPLYEKKLEITDEVITIHKIWQCTGRLLSSDHTGGDKDGRLKDVCLSFALFKLLSRRFAGYSLHECSRADTKTWNFVRYGLLADGSGPERAFRVIEVELAFLYDFFYTKYPVIFDKFGVFSRGFTIVGVVVSCWFAGHAISHYYSSSNSSNSRPGIRIGWYNSDVAITCDVIFAIALVEFVQLFYIIFSDWAKVILLCKYVQNPSWQGNERIEKMIEFVCHKWSFKPWERKLVQYSLFESFDHHPFKLVNKYIKPISKFVDLPRKGQKRNARIILPVEVKEAVIRSLKSNGRRLTNGVSSLQKNGVRDKFAWACGIKTQQNGVENEPCWACGIQTHVHVIMIWHIATSLCEIKSFKEEGNGGEDFIVATSLSKYCAYLVAFFPRQPDHPYTTESIFNHVVSEAGVVLGGYNSLENKYEKLMSVGQVHPGESDKTIMKKGAVLGRKLIVEIGDKRLRWKILADFWAEMMLFVAPSDDVTAHAENLTMGGEFITHLWALLSHAGILKRDPDEQGA